MMEALIHLAITVFQSPYGKMVLSMTGTAMYALMGAFKILKLLLGISMVPRDDVMVRDARGRWRERLGPGRGLGREIVHPHVFILAVMIKRWFRTTLFWTLAVSYVCYMLYAYGSLLSHHYAIEAKILEVAEERNQFCITQNLKWQDVCQNYTNVIEQRAGIFLPNLRIAAHKARLELHWLGFYSFEDVGRRISPILVRYTSVIMSNAIVALLVGIFALLVVDGWSSRPVVASDDAAPMPSHRAQNDKDDDAEEEGEDDRSQQDVESDDEKED